MARTYGRIAATIWSDGDFLAMRGSAQRMFMFLISQPDLSHAGLLPMRVKRWSTKAEDLSAKAIRDDLTYLAARDFVVVDEETEEVLIRTMVRNDGVYKQPKVMLRMREDARQIESPILRAAFRQELDRLPLDELNDKPGGANADQPSTRAQVEAVVDTLRDDFRDATGYPTPGVSDTQPDTPHVRAGAFPLPPSPFPQPPSTGHQDKPLSDKSDDDASPGFDEFWETYAYKVKRVDAERAWAKAAKKTDPARIIAAAAAYVAYVRADRDARGDRATDQAHAASWLNGERWLDERKDIAQPQTNMQAHMALVRQLAEEEPDPAFTLPQIGQRR